MPANFGFANVSKFFFQFLKVQNSWKFLAPSFSTKAKGKYPFRSDCEDVKC